MPTIRVSAETRESVKRVQALIVLKGIGVIPENIRKNLSYSGGQISMDAIISMGTELVRKEIEKND